MQVVVIVLGPDDLGRLIQKEDIRADLFRQNPALDQPTQGQNPVGGTPSFDPLVYG